MTTARVPKLPLDEAKAAADEAAVPDYMAELSIFQVLLNHPQLAGRGRWRQIGSPVGELAALLPPITLPGLEPRMAAVPELGEHTAAILADLGHDAAAVDALRAEGVI